MIELKILLTALFILVSLFYGVMPCIERPPKGEITSKEIAFGIVSGICILVIFVCTIIIIWTYF